MARIKVINGKIKRIVSLTEEPRGYRTVDEDSQIHIQFKKPVKKVYIEFKFRDLNFEFDRVEVYYITKKREAFSGNSCVRIDIFQEMKKCIYFDEDVYAIRLDPSIHSNVRIGDICITGGEYAGKQESWIKEKFSFLNEEKKKLLVFTHELSKSGAPILAYHIANGFRQKGYEVVVLTKASGDGFLYKKYKEQNILLLEMFSGGGLCPICTNDTSRAEIEKKYFEKVWSFLRLKGFKYAIANSTICGDLTYYCKKNNIKVISLVHEMRTPLERYHINEGTALSKYADVVVFPDDCVKEDFFNVFKHIQGRIKVRAQGLYLQEGVKEEYKGDVYRELGIPEGKPVIIGSGYTHLVKGIDLFLGAAQNLISQEGEQEFHFVWLGNFDCEKELEAWLMVPLRKEGLEERIHFIPFIQEQDKYKKVLETADIFWSTSRADSYPSTILEAMSVGTPVIAFKNAGGANTMLAEDRGLLIPNFDVHEMAVQTKRLLEDEDKRRRIKEKAYKFIEENSRFMDYIDFLESLLTEEKDD